MTEEERQYYSELADEIMEWRGILYRMLSLVYEWLTNEEVPDVEVENTMYREMAAIGREMVGKVEG